HRAGHAISPHRTSFPGAAPFAPQINTSMPDLVNDCLTLQVNRCNLFVSAYESFSFPCTEREPRHHRHTASHPGSPKRSQERLTVKLSLQDIAERAGVSTATVSRALNDRAGVHPKTREQILRIAREM